MKKDNVNVTEINIAVLLSGGGTNLKAILAAIRNDKLKNAKIVCVGSDNPEAYGLERAKESSIPIFTLDYKSALIKIKNKLTEAPSGFKLPSAVIDQENADKLMARAFAEEQLFQTLQQHKVELLVCAGYMKILTPYFLARFQSDPFRPRIVNIHPALLPAFPGTDGYEDAWKYGVKIYGSTVHFVDNGIDTGPIIGQTALRREENDTFEIFKERGLQAEWKLYPKCLQLLVDNRLVIELCADSKRKVVRILQKLKT